MFYGFGDYSTGQILQYIVIDLKAFRAQLVRQSDPLQTLKVTQLPNRDGSSEFKAIDTRSLNSECVLKFWQDESLFTAA